jgi:hypothetical protein
MIVPKQSGGGAADQTTGPGSIVRQKNFPRKYWQARDFAFSDD